MTRSGGARHAGHLWEQRAAEHLQHNGYRIVRRGYQCRLGELDIVASNNDVLVVVEVRARAKTGFGTAAETIGTAKRRRIVQATRHFLMRHPAWHTMSVRFDVIAFDDIAAAQPQMTWLQNAFQID